MQEIKIVHNLNFCRIDNIKGIIKIDDDYIKLINDIIFKYYQQYGEIPKIELAYGFLYDETPSKGGNPSG